MTPNIRPEDIRSAEWLELQRTVTWQGAENDRLRERVAQLEALVESDRTKVIDYCNALDKVLNSRFWITEGRGSYEWNDDRYRQEFHSAACEVLAVLAPLRRLGADLKNCPQTAEEVIAARMDKDKRITQLEAEIRRLRTELATAQQELAEANRIKGEYKQWLDDLAAAVYPTKTDRFTYSAQFMIEEIKKLRAERDEARRKLSNLMAAEARDHTLTPSTALIDCLGCQRQFCENQLTYGQLTSPSRYLSGYFCHECWSRMANDQEFCRSLLERKI